MSGTIFFLLLSVLLVGLLIAFAALVIATRGPVSVAATVADNPRLPVIALDDVRLHGQVSGPENAPLIVVLHGGPGADHRSLLALNALSDTHRVLIFDQRGAGLSDRAEADALTMDHYLRDLDTLIDRYASEQGVTLIGHSWGAMLAVAYMGHNPQAIARAVLIEPGFLDGEGYTEWDARRRQISRKPRVFFAGLIAGFRARNIADGDDQASRDYLIGSIVHAFANEPSNPYHCPGQPYSAPSWRFGGTASDTFWADLMPAITAMAKGIGHTAPILFLAGECDTWIGTDAQIKHARRFPNATVTTIPNAGHDVVWDQPEAALNTIRAFLMEPIS